MLVAGVNIPSRKKLFAALRYVKGIGTTTAFEVCRKANVDPDVRVHMMTDVEVTRVTEVLKGYVLEGELVARVMMDIRRLKNIGCYRGLRHRRALPVRGQRTQTNAMTAKKMLKAIKG